MKATATTLTTLAALMLPLSLHAQINFEHTYGGTDVDYGYSAVKTSDGGYVITGYTFSFGAGNADVYLIKTGAWGETLWTRTYGGIRRDRGRSVQQTAEGGFIIVGQTLSYGSGKADVYLIKTNADGDTLWTRAIGDTASEWGESVRQTSDSGYIIAGTTESHGAGAQDVYLVKTDGSGDTLWTRTFGGVDDDCGESVQQTADGGYIIAGYTKSLGAGSVDAYLVKTDAEGDTMWTRTFGGDSNDYGYSVKQTSDSGYITAGSSASYGAGGLDVYLVKTNATGDTLWTRTLGDTDNQEGWSVTQTADSGYVIVGYTQVVPPSITSVYLAKTNASGNKQWDRSYYAGPYWNYAYSVQQTADSGYVVAGATVLGNNDIQVYLIKTDMLGGTVAVAEPRTSPTIASDLTIACQPNPATGAATVRLSPFALRYSPLMLRMYDSQGRVVLTRDVSTLSFLLSTSDFPSGAYFLRLDAGGQHATTRLVLQR